VKSDFLTPVTRTTLTADICKKMVNQLIRGSWKSGEKIPPERDLCRQLGVGRASLREALKALEIIGMIEIRLGDGTYVCDRSDFLSRPLLWAIAGAGTTDADARELVEARTLIEVELAGYAAERASAEDIKRLSETIERMESTKKDPKEFMQADIGFHLAVARTASSKILMNALHLIRNLMQEWILGAISTKGVAEKACEQHKKVLRAIEQHDRAAAREAMQKHLQAMSDFMPQRKRRLHI